MSNPFVQNKVIKIPSNNVVVRYANHIVRGSIDREAFLAADSAQDKKTPNSLEIITLVREGATAAEDLPIEEAKAVFFVRSLEGNAGQRDIHFHDGAPLMENLWVRITFKDGEVMEGLTDNTGEYLHQSGFYLRPTDPTSNNLLAYVLKDQVADFRILGLRKAVKQVESLLR
jgi:hypothetical protein